MFGDMPQQPARQCLATCSCGMLLTPCKNVCSGNEGHGWLDGYSREEAVEHYCDEHAMFMVESIQAMRGLVT